MDILFPHLNIGIEKLDRVAFSIGSFQIYWYGIFICLGAVIGLILVTKIAKAQGQNPDTYTDFAIWALICGVIGARTYYLVFYEHSLKDFLAIRNGGLAIYGGIIGGFIAALVFTKIKKIKLLLFTDTISFGLLCGQIFGRWGNFINREAFGSYTDSLFALAYKTSTVSGLKIDGTQALYNNSTYPVTKIGFEDYIQVHPTFLYESFWNLCILIFLLFYRKKQKYTGELTVLYFLFYGIGRFFIESLRTDQLMIGPLPVSMVLSGLLAGSMLCIEIYMVIKSKNADTTNIEETENSSERPTDEN